MNVDSIGGAAVSPISPASSPNDNSPSTGTMKNTEDSNVTQSSTGSFTGISMHTGMSTQDSLCLHNQVHSIEPMCNPGMDLQKLMELIMAVKLLEAVSEKASNFSCVA